MELEAEAVQCMQLLCDCIVRTPGELISMPEARELLKLLKTVADRYRDQKEIRSSITVVTTLASTDEVEPLDAPSPSVGEIVTAVRRSLFSSASVYPAATREDRQSQVTTMRRCHAHETSRDSL